MLKDEAVSAFSKTGERSAKKFLCAHPDLVLWSVCRTAGHSVYVLSEFPFGSRYRADFVVPTSYSGAWDVHLIELEPTDDLVITQAGVPSQRLNKAISQIRDWKNYIDQNRRAFQHDLSDWCMKKDLLKWHIDDGPPSNYTNQYLRDPATFISLRYHIVIGRREAITSEKRQKVNLLTDGAIASIHSYDRYLDIAGNYDIRSLNSEARVSLTKTYGD